jgi:hypothetical protein
MAVLLSIGVLEPCQLSGEPHKAGPRAQEWMDRLSEIHLRSPLETHTTWLSLLREELRSKPDDCELGWFRMRELKEGLPRWENNQ